VAPGVGPEVADVRFYSCPLAPLSSGPLRDAVDTFRRLQTDGITLRDLVERPTAALLDCLTVTSETRSSVRAERERREYDALKEARRG
jgi:hypothetical protein